MGKVISPGGYLELVSALPGSPVDGMECLYQDATLAAQGAVWRLRYRSASASAYKWEFVGGLDFFESGAVVEAEGSAVAYTVTLLEPVKFTLPLSGDYDTWVTGTPIKPEAGNCDARLQAGNTAITKATEVTLGWAQGGYGFYTPTNNTGRITGLSSGEVIHMLQSYSAAKAKVVWYDKTLRVRPVRVG
jgi:hypothetical protein